MLGRRFSGLFLSSLLACTALAPAAAAQSTAPQKVAAEALFDDAIKLMKAGHHTEACPKLEESQRMDPGIGTLLYLGECYENVGRTASAWATFREAASRAGAEGQNERLKNATERASRLEPKLSYLTIQVAPETRALPGLSVKLGQTQLGSEFFGVATPVDPGESRVEVAAPGHASFSAALTVEAGGRYQLSVPALGQQAPAPQPTPPAAATTPDSAAGPSRATPGAAPASAPGPHGPSVLRPLGLVVGGVGIVALGAGSYFGLRAMKKNDDATSGTCRSGVCQERVDYQTAQDAHSAAGLANGFFIAGGAALAAGAVLFLVAPSSSEQGARFMPYATAREVGLSFGGQL